jgi:hypothetical protein
MKIRGFKSVVWLPLAPAELFDFFSDASNLHVLTSPWLHLRVVTPMPVEMKAGALIDYRLRVHGLPVHWRTHITLWDPPHRFDDEQIIGPYRRWLHTHVREARWRHQRVRSGQLRRAPGFSHPPVVLPSRPRKNLPVPFQRIDEKVLEPEMNHERADLVGCNKLEIHRRSNPDLRIDWFQLARSRVDGEFNHVIGFLIPRQKPVPGWINAQSPRRIAA